MNTSRQQYQLVYEESNSEIMEVETNNIGDTQKIRESIRKETENTASPPQIISALFESVEWDAIY